MQRRKSEWIRVSTSKTFDRGFSLQCAPQKQPISSRIRVNVDKYRMLDEHRDIYWLSTFATNIYVPSRINFHDIREFSTIVFAKMYRSLTLHSLLTFPSIQKSRKQRWRNPRLESWHQLINNYDAEWGTRER